MTTAPSTGLVDALRRHGLADVDDSALARSLYASDAGLYRIPPQVVVRPRDTDEIVATLAAARETGVPVTMRGAGTSIAGNADRRGHRDRHQQAPQPGARARRGRADRTRPAGRRARGAPATGGRGRAALRPRPVHAHPLHHRRDDRQQRLRLAGPGLRADGRQRRGDDGPARRRVVVRLSASGFETSLALAPRPPGISSTPSSTSTSARCGPSSGGSAARSRATPSSTCCRRTAAGSTGSWSAPRARWASSWTRPCDWSRTRPPGRSQCWATRRWPMPRTPYPHSSGHDLVACEGLDQRIAGMVRSPTRAAPRATAGCSPR